MQSCSTVLHSVPLLCLPGNTNKWPHRRLLPKASISLGNITQAILGPTTHAWGPLKGPQAWVQGTREFPLVFLVGNGSSLLEYKKGSTTGHLMTVGSLRLAILLCKTSTTSTWKKPPLDKCIYYFAILVIDKVFEHLISYWYQIIYVVRMVKVKT